jgi:hypothetical protein
MRSTVALLICLLLTGCNKDTPEAAPSPVQEAVETTAQPDPLPQLPPPELEQQPHPSVVEYILRRANSTAKVSFTTNGSSVDCKLKSPNTEDRSRVRDIVSQLFGIYRGTVEPPTITFKFQPLLLKTAQIPNSRPPVGPGDDEINARLRDRVEFDEAKELREIRELQAEVERDEADLLRIQNRALALGKSDILFAKKDRLGDLKAHFTRKYNESP